MAIQKYQKEYLIRSYECDKHENLRLLTLMNILQDAADSHADNLGLGYAYCVSHHLAWVAANYHVKIMRAPKIHEQVTIHTWPSEEKKLGAIRDYQMTDSEGHVIVQASTQWVLINFETKRPVPLRANLPEYAVVSEKADSFEFTRLPAPEKYNFETEFTVRFDDIDVNNHVNNAVYPLWMSEAVPSEFRDKHTVSELEIAFKKEVLVGETVKISTYLEGNKSYHEVTSAADGRELAKASFTWVEV